MRHSPVAILGLESYKVADAFNKLYCITRLSNIETYRRDEILERGYPILLK